MDVINIIIWIIILYILWTLISTISSLRYEIKEMKDKCIKNNIQMNSKNTDDPRHTLFEFAKSYFL